MAVLRFDAPTGRVPRITPTTPVTPAVLEGLRGRGVAVVVATHDVELVAQVADHAVVLAQGEVIARGGAREVVCHTPAFAPQVAKVLSPLAWLTVREVASALGGPAR